MAKNYWKRLNTKTLFTHPRLTVVEDDVLLPTGTTTQYLRHEGLNDYVTVIAQRDNKIAMIREYSYPHDEWLWQFPEGVVDSGEDPEAGAKRELLEETGLKADEFVKLGTNYDHHRRTTVKNYIYQARGISEGQKSDGDEEEHGTETHWFTAEEIKQMLRDGQIVQKNALAALALYFVDGE